MLSLLATTATMYFRISGVFLTNRFNASISNAAIDATLNASFAFRFTRRNRIRLGGIGLVTF